jgi:5-methylcytosine-specific restriction enzyme subunit McrC
MITDIYLKCESRRLIIDTKYYTNTLQKSLHGSESFNSNNLYQLFAYLKNVAAAGESDVVCEGMLLYPQVQGSLRETYVIQGHPVTIATIDLARPWPAITDYLLALIEPPATTPN